MAAETFPAPTPYMEDKLVFLPLPPGTFTNSLRAASPPRSAHWHRSGGRPAHWNGAGLLPSLELDRTRIDGRATTFAFRREPSGRVRCPDLGSGFIDLSR